MIANPIETMLSPALFDLAGLKMEGPAILVVPFLFIILFLSVASFVWLYKDARKRKKHPWLALAFVLLTGWPLSFLWWLWLRPPQGDEQKAAAI